MNGPKEPGNIAHNPVTENPPLADRYALAQKPPKITILAYPRSESWLLGHPGLWSTSLLQRRITLSHRRYLLARRHGQYRSSPPPIYRRPRPNQFGWFAMIIAVVGRFVIGAAVVALGSAGTTGKAAAITPVRETAQTTSGHRS